VNNSTNIIYLSCNSKAMKYWNPEIETMDVSTVRSMQERKLRNMVRLAYHHSPFYKRLFREHNLSPLDIRSIDDLKKIPFTKKEHLMEQPKDFILQPTEVSLRKTLPTTTKLRAVFYDKLMSMEKVTSELKEEYKPVMFVVSSGRASGMPTPVFYTKKDLDIFADVERALVLQSEEQRIPSFISPFLPGCTWPSGSVWLLQILLEHYPSDLEQA